MSTDTVATEQPRRWEQPSTGPYLTPIEKPRRLVLKVLYWVLGRQFGTVPSWLTVFGARVPLAFTSWMGKVNTLNKKLKLPSETVALIRARVDSLNTCTWCMDAGRWYAITKAPEFLPRLDALSEYRTSPLFSDRERAALDFATELTEHKSVRPETFSTTLRHYSEREMCEIVWVVSSNYLFNINNLGLGIGSDGLCDLQRKPNGAAREPSGRADRAHSPHINDVST